MRNAILAVLLFLGFSGCVVDTQYDYRLFGFGEPGVVVLGDSRMVSAPWLQIGHRVVDYSQSGSDINNIIPRVQYLSHFKFDIIYCQTGINDLANGNSADKFIESYSKVIDGLKAYTDKVIIGSIIGLAVGSERTIDENVQRQMNIRLKTLCAEKGVVYLDCNFMEVDDVHMNTAYASKDGVHINWTGYMILMEAIKNRINSL